MTAWPRFGCAVALATASMAGILATGVASAGAATALPDGRVLELVTPTASPGVHVDAMPIARVGSDGNEVAFETWGNRDVGAANTLETYLSTRTPGGWSSSALPPTKCISAIQHFIAPKARSSAPGMHCRKIFPASLN